eukprot:gene13653-16077_t
MNSFIEALKKLLSSSATKVEDTQEDETVAIDEEIDDQLRGLICEIKALELEHPLGAEANQIREEIDKKREMIRMMARSNVQQQDEKKREYLKWGDKDFSLEECMKELDGKDSDDIIIERVVHRVLDYGMPVEKLLRLSAPLDVLSSDHACKKEFGPLSWRVRCKTCCLIELAVLCIDCFKRGNHIALGHEYEIYRMPHSAGFCDCGDTDYILEAGCCEAHAPQERDANPCAMLPVSVEQPFRMLIRGILNYIATTQPSQRQVRLINYLHDLATTSYVATFIVCQEASGHQMDTARSPLPFSEYDPDALYPMPATKITPLLPLVLQSSSLNSMCTQLVVFLSSLPPFRISLTTAMLEQYPTLDLFNPKVRFEDCLGFIMTTAVSHQSSLAYTTDPRPSHNIIHLLIKRLSVIFHKGMFDPQAICGLTPTDGSLVRQTGSLGLEISRCIQNLQIILKKDMNRPFITANNNYIIQSLCMALQDVQDFTPVLRELVHPYEYSTPLCGDLIVNISELLSSLVPTLAKLSPESKNNFTNSVNVILGYLPKLTNDRFFTHKGMLLPKFNFFNGVDFVSVWKPLTLLFGQCIRHLNGQLTIEEMKEILPMHVILQLAKDVIAPQIMYDLHFRGLMKKTNVEFSTMELYHRFYNGEMSIFLANYLSNLLGSRHFITLLFSHYTSNFTLEQDDNPYALADMLRYYIQVIQLGMSSTDEASETRHNALQLLLTGNTNGSIILGVSQETVNGIIAQLTVDGKVRQELWKEFDPYYPLSLLHEREQRYRKYLESIKHPNADSLAPPPIRPQGSTSNDNSYIQSNDKTISEQDILALRARGLAHQKAIKEKMAQQQKNFSDSNEQVPETESRDSCNPMVDTAPSTSEHTCVICHEGSQPDFPLGAICRLDYSYLRRFALKANLTPTIRATRPEYANDLSSLYNLYRVPDNASEEIELSIRLSVSSVPILMTTCKHLTHQSCLDSYSGGKEYFTCPLCNSIRNALLPIDASSSLSESFYARYRFLAFEKNLGQQSLAMHDHIIISLLFNAIELLEIRARPSTFMTEPDQPAFYPLSEPEFQSQLTSIRMLYHAIKPLISQRSKDLIKNYLAGVYQYDPVCVAIFSLYNGDLESIRLGYIYGVLQCTHHVIDQDHNGLSLEEKQSLLDNWIARAQDGDMDEVIGKVEKIMVPFIRRLYILQHCAVLTTIGKTSLECVEVPTGFRKPKALTLGHLNDRQDLIKRLEMRSVRDTIQMLPKFRPILRDKLRYLVPQPIEMVQLPNDFTDFLYDMNSKVPSYGCDSGSKAMCLLCSETLPSDKQGVLLLTENFYFDRRSRQPATQPGQHLTLSKSAYRQLYSNLLKGTYEDKANPSPINHLSDSPTNKYSQPPLLSLSLPYHYHDIITSNNSDANMSEVKPTPTPTTQIQRMSTGVDFFVLSTQMYFEEVPKVIKKEIIFRNLTIQ